MNFNKKIMLTSVAVLPFFINIANAESNEGIVTAYVLNVRTGPDKSYDISFYLNQGEKVNIKGMSNGFYNIVTENKKEGWASAKYIKLQESSVTSIKYTATYLNMRTGPSTSYSIITTLTQGAEVQVISESNGWSKIKYNSKEGYVSSKYLKLKQNQIQIKYVNVDALNVRSEPSTSSQILKVYKKGQEIKVVSISDGWAKIEYNGGHAYISNKYLVDEKIETTQIKYVNVDALNVRSGPSTSSQILTVYKKGQEVKVVSISDDWAKIQYNDGYAYVSNKYLVDILENDKNELPNYGGGVSSGNVTYESLSYSFTQMVDYEYQLALKGYNKIRANLSTSDSTSTAYVNATREDLQKYLNPDTFNSNSNGKLQFLRLDKYKPGITASQLNSYFNKYCKSHSVFLGKGQAFIDASKKYNLDISYLVAASMLETGYGVSELAQGVYVTGENGEQVKVYNFFGIAAYDGTAVVSAANYAYKQGWTTVDKTIDGCAKWISDNYIHNSKYNQNTLYKMRWIYKAGHQYATDITWPNVVATIMNRIISSYSPNANLEYIIPKYK